MARGSRVNTFDHEAVVWSSNVVPVEVNMVVNEIVRLMKMKPGPFPDRLREILNLIGCRCGTRRAAVALLVLGPDWVEDDRDELLSQLEDEVWRRFKYAKLVEGELADGPVAAGRWKAAHYVDIVVRYAQGKIVCFQWCKVTSWLSVYVTKNRAEVRKVKLPCIEGIETEMGGFLSQYIPPFNMEEEEEE